MTWDVAALLLGLIVVIGLALLTSPLAERTDDAMLWEGRVAVGFTAVVFVGPFWLAQGIVTLIATLDDGGVGPGWLWGWFAAAPVLGGSPPATVLARVVHRVWSRGEPAAFPTRSVAAVEQEANFAWAATEAEPGWELRRTPPLPESWPPRDGGRSGSAMPSVPVRSARSRSPPPGRGSRSRRGQRAGRSSNGSPMK